MHCIHVLYYQVHLKYYSKLNQINLKTHFHLPGRVGVIDKEMQHRLDQLLHRHGHLADAAHGEALDPQQGALRQRRAAAGSCTFTHPVT